MNDEPPKFDRREYYVEIPENIIDGMPLPNLKMFVEDPDVVSIIMVTRRKLQQQQYLEILGQQFGVFAIAQ